MTATSTHSFVRTRWAAIGAAVAISLGAGGIGLASATTPADAVAFVPITPCRVLDTRPAPDTVGDKSSPLGPAEIHTVAAHGDNGNCTDIPADATALSLNVTALGASEPTFLTIWAAGETQPDASSLNPVPGAPPTPNAVTTGLNNDGEFSIYNLQGSVDVLADINGYYVDHDHEPTGEVVTGTSGTAGPSFTPDHVFDRSATVTTTIDGYLDITASFAVLRSCEPVGTWYYLLVDGVPVESSTILRRDNGFLSITYAGTTADPVEAGEHTIGIGAECVGGVSAGIGSRNYVDVAVVVVPSS